MVPLTALLWHYESSSTAQETNARLRQTWERTSAWLAAMSEPAGWPANAKQWLGALPAGEAERLGWMVEALLAFPQAQAEASGSTWRVLYTDGEMLTFTAESLGAAIGLEGPIVRTRRPYWNDEASAIVCAHIERGLLGSGLD